MDNPQKLHPLAYISGFISFIKNMIFPIAIYFFNNGFRNIGDITQLSAFSLVILGLVVVFLLIAIIDVINIYRTRFWIEGNKFIYKDGVFVKREKEFNIQRIDSVDITEPFFLRIFGASRLSVTTPGDGLVIKVIKKSQAENLQHVLYREKERAVDETEAVGAHSKWPKEEEPKEDTGNILHQMSTKHLLLMSMTGGAVGTFIVTIVGLMSTLGVNMFIDQYVDFFYGNFARPILAMVIGGVSFIVIAYLVGTAILYIKYYDYTLKSRNADLVVEYGLLDKKHRSVNIERVQAVVIEDSLIRRMFGFYSLNVIISTDAGSLNTDSNKIELLPFIKKHELYEIVRDILPSYEIVAPKGSVPLRGYRRFFQIRLLFLILVFGLLQVFSGIDFYWFIGVVFATIAILFGIYSARNTGFEINESSNELNMMSTAFLKRSHYAVKRDRIIHVETVVHPFLRMSKLSIITTTIAAGMLGRRITLKFLHEDDVTLMWDWIGRGHIHHEEDFKTRSHLMEN